MITETNYSYDDLENGKCTSCGDETNEILPADGRCVDCIEADKFYEQSMKIFNNPLNNN